MKYKFVSLSNPNWNAHTHELRKKMGVKTHDWPPEGMGAQMVDGIKVWVLPKAESLTKSSTHRAMCQCPGCGDIMSAGRLHQHKCNAKRRNR